MYLFIIAQTIIPLRCLIAANPCDCSGIKQTKPLRCYYCRVKQSHAVSLTQGIVPASPKLMRLHFAVPFGRHMWKLDTQVFRPLENTDLKEWIDTIYEILSGKVY